MSTKKVKAVKCWSQGGGEYWHIPATPEAYEQMVEQIAKKLRAKDFQATYERDARYALAAIGITQPQKTK